MSNEQRPPQTPTESSEEDYEEDAHPDEGQWQNQNAGKPIQPGAPGHFAISSPPRITAVPMQKRRRVTRACDECRRKKIKCDGKQPCTHCTVYSYGKHFPTGFRHSNSRRFAHLLPKNARMTNRPIGDVILPLNISRRWRSNCSERKTSFEMSCQTSTWTTHL